MEQILIEGMLQNLKAGLKEKFGFGDDQIEKLTNTGKDVLLKSLKSFIMKHGSGEIEEIMLSKHSFNGSVLEKFINEALETAIRSMQTIGKEQVKAAAAYASGSLVDSLISAYIKSNHSNDVDGICAFLGIDKKLLKMINSPVGRVFGKFF